MSKFFIGFAFTVWATIGLSGYFVFKLLWDIDSFTVHPFRILVALTLALLWFCWLIVGGAIGVAALHEGLKED